MTTEGNIVIKCVIDLNYVPGDYIMPIPFKQLFLFTKTVRAKEQAENNQCHCQGFLFFPMFDDIQGTAALHNTSLCRYY